MIRKKASLIHYPQPVYLPGSITRDLRIDKRHQDGKPLDETDKAEYDNKTLFYDMFFISSSLYCIGPPFLNIGTPRAIRSKGKKLRWTIETSGERYSLLRIAIDEKQYPSQLEFSFSQFQINIACPIPKNFALRKEEVSLVTLQKNNPIVWIKDWCRWHRRAHNIKRIVIYDNGSECFSQLSKDLSQWDEDMEFIFVHWPFIHGPRRSYYNKYCKDAALNHYRVLFGTKTKWCVNLDIDEYLYSDQKIPLARYLAQIASQPVIYLGSYLFPPGQQPNKRQPRFFHHRERYKENNQDFWWAHKYICQLQKIVAMETHHVWVASSLREKMGCHLKNLIKTILRIIGIYRAKKFIYSTQLLPHKKENYFFCHFRGLYTGWRGTFPLNSKTIAFNKINSMPAEMFTVDERVINRAVEVGMIEKSEIEKP